MGRFLLAVRCFFGVLFNAAVARRARELLTEPTPAVRDEAPAGAKPAPEAARGKPAPARNDALILLSVLQREARLVDFLREDLAGYSDAQVGAAVRDIHRGCGAVLERMFAPRPVLAQEEGSQVEVPAGFDAARYRLTGNVSGQAPFRGRLCHGGWEASRCELPTWSGSAEAARVIAPVEVELS